jgi:catechol 2,3-dioxygenase-like lactoylglutathione lyase family enzyme
MPELKRQLSSICTRAHQSVSSCSRAALPGTVDAPSATRFGQEEQGMIAHTTLAVSNYQKSKAFYGKALEPLGYHNNMEYGDSAGFNDGKVTDFWISQEDTVQPTHLAFQAQNREQVEAFHKAALAAGGKDNGGPGYRKYWPGYYAAFVHDPDGNNIEAVWFDYSKAE